MRKVKSEKRKVKTWKECKSAISLKEHGTTVLVDGKKKRKTTHHGDHGGSAMLQRDLCGQQPQATPVHLQIYEKKFK